MSSIGKTLAAACSWPADAAAAAAAEVAAAAAVAAASVLAAVAGVLAAVGAAASVDAAASVGAAVAAAAGSVSSGSAAVAAGADGGLWVVAAHPGERAACAKSHEKRSCDGRRPPLRGGTVAAGTIDVLVVSG